MSNLHTIMQDNFIEVYKPSIWTPLPQDAPIYPLLMTDKEKKILEKKRQLEIMANNQKMFRNKNINTQCSLLQISYPDKTIYYNENSNGTISFFGHNLIESMFLGTYSF